MIPVVVGALLGLAVSYVRLRSRLARDERGRAEVLRARLAHVERHQAVWVVAAATLHELKNPLHAMGLLVEELDATEPSNAEVVRDLSAKIRALMDRTLVPLAALRELARIDSRRGAEEPIARVAQQVVRDLAIVSLASGIDLHLEGSLRAGASADASWVRIILENLIGNSLEGMREGRCGHRILIRLKDLGTRAAISVSDDGPGLSKVGETTVVTKVLGDRLFHPLATSKKGGLGLGLPIARALARAMDGDLAYSESPGWSTTFELTLPIAIP